MTQASCVYDLGDGFVLNAFAVDPKLDGKGLRELVVSKDGTGGVDLAEQSKKTIFVEKLDSLDDLEIIVADKKYQVPEQFQVYRDAVEVSSNLKGRYPGPVAIVDGPVKNPLRVFPGNFYDFIATKLDAIPSNEGKQLVMRDALWRQVLDIEGRYCTEIDLGINRNGTIRSQIEKSHEVASRFVGKYPEDATVEELFDQGGINNDARGKYFGIAYLLSTDGGKELSLVQRAKGMAIAADCISSPGSTPNPPFDDTGFDFKSYLRGHITEEMGEEYKMSSGEFEIGNIYLFDDKEQVPFMAVEARTGLSTGDLAKRIYGDAGAIKEHPALFSFSPNAIPIVLDRFEVFPTTAYVMDVYNKNR